MAFGNYLGNGFKALFFNADAVAQIRDDPDSFKHGLILLTILALVGAVLYGLVMMLVGAVLGAMFSGGSQAPVIGIAGGFGLAGFIGAFIVIWIGGFIAYGITHLFAKLFGGQANIKQMFSGGVTFHFAAAIVSIGAFILGLIPLLGLLIILAWEIYIIIAYIFLVREIYQFSTGRAVGAVLLPVVVFIILWGLLLMAGSFSVARF